MSKLLSQTEKNQAKKLEFDEKYVYHQDDDKYIVYLKRASKPIVIDGDTHRSMQRAYCGSDGRSLAEISAAHSIPEFFLIEYKNIFGWTRGGCVLTDEEVSVNTVEKSVDEMLAYKKFEIIQEFNKQSWRKTEEEAAKWRAYVNGEAIPIKKALDNWNPPARSASLPAYKSKGNSSYVMFGSDWHIGGKLEKHLSFRKNEWNVETFKKFLDRYVRENKRKIGENVERIKEIVFVSLGDILDGLRSKTEKGTDLEQDIDREGQFKLGLSSMSKVLDNLMEFGIPIRVMSLKGNHDSMDHWTLFEAIRRTYEPLGVKFVNKTERLAFLSVNNSLLLLEHGAHDIMRSKVPTNKSGREAYVMSLFMTRPDLLEKHKYKYFIQGDLHSNQMIEHNSFDFIMVSSPAKSLYADANNWDSRPSQSSLLVTDKGVSDIFRFYFD